MGNRQKPTKTNWFFHKQTKQKKKPCCSSLIFQTITSEWIPTWTLSLKLLSGFPWIARENVFRGGSLRHEPSWQPFQVAEAFPNESCVFTSLHPLRRHHVMRPHTFNEWSAAQFYYCQMKGPAGVKTWLWWNEHRHVLHSSSPLIPLNLSLLRWRILRKGAALKGKAAVL